MQSVTVNFSACFENYLHKELRLANSVRQICWYR